MHVGLRLFPLLATADLTQLFALPLTDPVIVFAVLMAVILIVPLLCRLIHVPDVVGLVLAGIALGPHALHILSDTGAVELLAKVGLIYIMFQAGLEIDMNGFSKKPGRAATFGALSFLLPMTVGAALIYAFLHVVAGVLAGPDLWPTILLLASVFASCTLLSYPIITRLGIIQNPAVTTTLGGTIITDTLSLMTLAIIAALVQGNADLTFWLVLFGSVVAYIGFVALVIPRISRWFYSNLEADGPMQYVFTLAIVFFCATLAMVAGMEDIIGAFFAGLAINRLIPKRSTLANRIDFVGQSLFIPIFLLSVGMIVNLPALGNPGMWSVAGVILGSVFITKSTAVFATSKLFKYTRSQGMVIFGLCVAQAAATLAITKVGYDAGLFNDAILNSVVMLILVTCMVSPWVTERWGRKVALEGDASLSGENGSPQRLLIPLANPETIESLMKMAMLLHDTKSEEPLYPLTVAKGGDNADKHVEQGEKNLERAVEVATEANIDTVRVTTVAMNVATGIIRALTENRISTVLIGWNGQISTERRIFGTILDRLLDGSDQTIFVYRHMVPTIDHQRITLAIPPFSTRLPGFSNALHQIWTICEQLGQPLHVITPRDGRDAVERAFDDIPPQVDADFIDIPTWDDMLDTLQETTSSRNDLLILMAARPGSIAWGPDIDRVPRKLARHFPKNSFMVVYPRNLRDVARRTMASAETPRLRRFVHQGGEPLRIDAEDPKAAIRAITAQLPAEVQGDNLAELIRDSARSSSIRVNEGTVLLDAHDANIRRSSIVVANAGDHDITFKHIPEPVRHIWVLITGSDITEADHRTIISTMFARLQQHDPDALQHVHTASDVTHVLGA